MTKELMLEIDGHVSVYESSDGGKGDLANTQWIFFVDGQAVNTNNPWIAETIRLAIMTHSRVRIQYDSISSTVSQVRIEYDYVCETKRYSACDKPGDRF